MKYYYDPQNRLPYKKRLRNRCIAIAIFVAACALIVSCIFKSGERAAQPKGFVVNGNDPSKEWIKDTLRVDSSIIDSLKEAHRAIKVKDPLTESAAKSLFGEAKASAEAVSKESERKEDLENTQAAITAAVTPENPPEVEIVDSVHIKNQKDVFLAEKIDNMLRRFKPMHSAILVVEPNSNEIIAWGETKDYKVQNAPDYITRNTFPFLRTEDTTKLMFTFSCAVFWTGIFNSIQEVSKERPIYQRERFSGVGVVPYIFSKIVPLSVLCLIQSAIMTAILSFMSNTTATFTGNLQESGAIAMSMRPDGLILGQGAMWLETLLTTFLCAMSAMCLGLLISTLVSNEIALVLCPICLMPQILFSGIVVDLSGLTGTIANIISCKWSCAAYLISARVNELYDKVNVEYMPTRYEAVPFPEDAIKKFVFDADHKYIFKLPIGDGVVSGWFVLLLICVVCVVASMLILRFKRIKTR